MKLAKTHCDRCGKNCVMLFPDFVPLGELTELLDCYKVHGVTHLCSSCGSEAGSFVNYYGVKKTEDKIALSNFLQSGKVSGPIIRKLHDQLTNAGYFKVEKNDSNSN